MVKQVWVNTKSLPELINADCSLMISCGIHIGAISQQGHKLLFCMMRSQVKTRQSQSYKFKKIAKNPIFLILQLTLHVTHLLKLLDKMYKYDMDPTRTVGATERTRDTGRTDGQTDRWTEWNQYTPPTTSLCGGYNYKYHEFIYPFYKCQQVHLFNSLRLSDAYMHQ